MSLYWEKQNAARVLRLWEMGFAPTESEMGILIGLLRNATDPDSLSELGEMEALRLAMAMERLARKREAMSNMLKKIADTSAGITQNLK